MMLKIKKLHPKAILPTVAYPGTDLGYDLYSIERVRFYPGEPMLVKTGITAELSGYGFLIQDRSSMAQKGFIVSGGVIDADYRGEIKVFLTVLGARPLFIEAGDKIAQMIPIRSNTFYPIIEVPELTETNRNDKGFGSTGR